MDKSEIEKFFQIVMYDLGYKGWQLRWMPSDAYCWRSSHIIDICPRNTLAECKQLLLHEVAHIRVIEPIGSQHTLRFWKHLKGLVRKYLNSGLDMHQKKLLQLYCPEEFEGPQFRLTNTSAMVPPWL